MAEWFIAAVLKTVYLIGTFVRIRLITLYNRNYSNIFAKKYKNSLKEYGKISIYFLIYIENH